MTSTATNRLADTPDSYGVLSRVNHWVIATAMIGMLASGLVMAYGPFAREVTGAILGWHKAVGVLVLGFGLWRVGWRVAQGFPADAAPMPRWQSALSKAAHWGLLATVVVMPLSGMVGSLFGGHSIDVFGLIIPSFSEIEWLSGLGHAVHGYAAWALLGLLVLHVGAALKHHLLDCDPTLRRMIGGAA